MDFGEILDAWEKGRVGRRGGGAGYEERPGKKKRTDAAADARRLGVQAELDLHGLNGREAEQALERFVQDARRRGLRKILVIHGKGHHSQGEPVLQRVVRSFLEKCPYTGAFGPAGRKQGGRGATWVAVRDG